MPWTIYCCADIIQTQCRLGTWDAAKSPSCACIYGRSLLDLQCACCGYYDFILEFEIGEVGYSYILF